MVPQNTHPAFDYTVLEMALMGRYPHLGAFEVESHADIWPSRARPWRRRAPQAFATRLFSTLSGGEKQRVVIASALAQQAELLLLDEPTASLDPGYQLEIAELLRALNRQRGIGLVLSTHDLNLAASVCDRSCCCTTARSWRPAPPQTSSRRTPSRRCTASTPTCGFTTRPVTWSWCQFEGGENGPPPESRSPP